MELLKDIWEWMDQNKNRLASAFWAVYVLVIPIWITLHEFPILDKTFRTIGALLTFYGFGKDAMKYTKKVLPILLLAFLLSYQGCAKTKKQESILPVEEPWFEEVKDTIAQVVEPVKLPEEVKNVPISATVYFDFDSSIPTQPELARLLGVLGDINGRCLILTGHCDPIGTDSYNFGLGLARASEIESYFTKQSCRMETVSYGESSLVTANPEEYYLNRRVEIVSDD